MKKETRKTNRGVDKSTIRLPCSFLIFIIPLKHPLVYPMFQVWRRGGVCHELPREQARTASARITYANALKEHDGFDMVLPLKLI